MFDWNHEEVTNIVGAEDDARDDHIVPFSKQGEQQNQRGIYGEKLKNVWETEDDKSMSSQRDLSGKTDMPRLLNKLESYTHHGMHKRNCSTAMSLWPERNCSTAMSLWPDLSLSDASRTDQDSFDTDLSNNLTEITKLDSSKGVIPQVNKGSEAFQNEDDDRVQSDFLDYGWANIGSFDDLDRIFSNEDSIFGNANLGNDNELWSSSKTLTASPEKLFPSSLDSPSSELGVFRGSSNQYESLLTNQDKMEYTGNMTKQLEDEENNLAFPRKTSSLNTQLNNDLTDKVLVSRKSSKRRRKNFQRKNWPDYHSTMTKSGNHFHQLNGQLGLSIPSQYQPFAYPLMNQNQNQYANKAILPPYKASPTNLNPLKSKPPGMTPQEKIEKLRRRQKMQALLVVHKQQEQYTPHTSSDEYCPIEVAILRRIQSIIDKLDVNTRICIRDSLFRLAHSAQMRLCSNDTSSSMSNEDISTHKRFSHAPCDTETETNPIDRAVANLLFHRHPTKNTSQNASNVDSSEAGTCL